MMDPERDSESMGTGREPESDELPEQPPIPDEDRVPKDVVQKVWADVRDRYAKERLKRRELEKQIEELGGLDELKEAAEVNRLRKSPEGIKQLFVAAGRALGLPLRDLEAVVELDESALDADADETDEEDEDRPLTRKEALRLLEELDRRQRGELIETQARRVIGATLRELGVTDDTVARTVLTLGDKHLAPGDYEDLDKIEAAVRKGYEEFEKLMEAKAEEYARKKAEKAAKTPRVVGGASPGAPEQPKAKTLEEARQRLLRRLGMK